MMGVTGGQGARGPAERCRGRRRPPLCSNDGPTTDPGIGRLWRTASRRDAPHTLLSLSQDLGWVHTDDRSGNSSDRPPRSTTQDTTTTPASVLFFNTASRRRRRGVVLVFLIAVRADPRGAY
mmetsp:Transcript_15360/g.61798  ORF Transcript_15360/g.61798 Transcript_15360/m.61798 type:complete len:122 (-) Transcript_15360:360-725(-)